MFLTKKIELSLILLLIANLNGQDINPTSKSPEPRMEDSNNKIIGFEDENQDGINDLFFDEDGDGRNDIDNKMYKHSFKFVDENGDNINDMWVDRDGDGVNDLSYDFNGEKRKDRHQNVLDTNTDGINDITGDKYDYKNQNWMGHKRGFWDENSGDLQGSFIDEDADGIDDRLNSNRYMNHGQQRMNSQDTFIDEDGDGICDWRTDFLNNMGKHGRDNHMGGKDNTNGSHHK